MIYLVIGLVGFIVLMAVAAYFADALASDGLWAVAICAGVCGFITAIVVIASGYEWTAAGHRAQVINREYGTHYTQSDIFYADDVIDTIQQIKRQRVEVNGNIMQTGVKTK